MRCLVIITVSAFLNAGCSFASPSSQNITIIPSDPRADVFVDGRPLGKGTIQTRLKKSESHAVMARVGDRVGVGQVDRSISTSGMLDIVGGVLILLPLLGLFAPGFWKLDPDVVAVAIPPGQTMPEVSVPPSDEQP